MKAHVLYGVNDIRYEDVEKPSPGKDEVLVRVEAVGVCGSDIPRIYETGAHRHPLIPGHEFAGTVCEVGEDAEALYAAKKMKNRFSAVVYRNGDIASEQHNMTSGDNSIDSNIHASLLGKRVGIFPLIPCGECSPCKNKQYEMCRNYNYLGSRCDGGFAEYVKVPVWNLIELPDNVSFEDAAMLEPTSVAAHAMRRMFAEEPIACVSDGEEKSTDMKLSGNERILSGSDTMMDNSLSLSQGKSVAVIGLGTIGLLLTMHLLSKAKTDSVTEYDTNAEPDCITKGRIHNIYVIGNKEFQRQKACELGIDPANYCDGTKEDVVQWLMTRTDGMGADYVFECVGKNETISQAVSSVAPAGRVMLLGNPASDITFDKNTYWKILRNQLTVMGSWNSSFTGNEDDDWHYVVNRLAAGKLHPSKLISHRLELSELEKGLHIMRDKTADYVKVMIRSEK